MRSRLTLAFGLLAVLLAGSFVAFRTVSITDLSEAQVQRQVQREAVVVATLLDEWLGPDAAPPSSAALAPFAVPDRQVIVVVGDRGTSQADGDQWRPSDHHDALQAVATVGEVTATVRTPRHEVDETISAALPSLLALGAGLIALAVLLGALVAARLSRPFADLAVAATALARGRSDLHLPRTRIAEARAIGVALQGGADQLGASLRRERDLALRASHELRTPLTSLSLALHDLTDRDDAPPDLIAAAELAARHVERLDRAVGEVLEETRRHPVVAAAQLPLSLVVPALAQRWATTLSLAKVPVEVELLGDAGLEVTPGPLEQILEQVLLAVLACRGSRVVLVVDGSERHVRVTVTVAGATPPLDTTGPLEKAGAVLDTVGGKMRGDLAGPRGLTLVLPRR
ncbi:MAG: HAMP domain-containing sensor histidine kinase [Nocardioides sp.]